MMMYQIPSLHRLGSILLITVGSQSRISSRGIRTSRLPSMGMLIVGIILRVVDKGEHLPIFAGIGIGIVAGGVYRIVKQKLVYKKRKSTGKTLTNYNYNLLEYYSMDILNYH